MYLYKTRKHDRHMRRFDGLFLNNAVLTMGLALPFVISATFSLQAAVCVIIGMVISTLPVMVLSLYLRRRLPLWLRVPIYTLTASLILIPVYIVLNTLMPVTINALGVYFPVIAVNTILIYRCEKMYGHKNMRALINDAVLHLLGFSLIMVIISLIREVFGNGTVWNIPVSGISFKLSALLIPFAGCIVTAFLAAGAKWVGRLWRIMLYKSDLGERERRPRELHGENFLD